MVSGTELDPVEREELRRVRAPAGERLRRLVTTIGATARLDRDGSRPNCFRRRSVELIDAVTRGLASTGFREPRPRAPRGEILVRLDLAVVAVSAVIESGLRVSRQDAGVELDADPFGLRRSRSASTGHGLGISDYMAQTIFEPFIQADSGNMRLHAGMGLGLYLSRRVMETHGGGFASRSTRRVGASSPSRSARSTAFAEAG